MFDDVNLSEVNPETVMQIVETLSQPKSNTRNAEPAKFDATAFKDALLRELRKYITKNRSDSNGEIKGKYWLKRQVLTLFLNDNYEGVDKTLQLVKALQDLKLTSLQIGDLRYFNDDETELTRARQYFLAWNIIAAVEDLASAKTCMERLADLIHGTFNLGGVLIDCIQTGNAIIGSVEFTHVNLASIVVRDTVDVSSHIMRLIDDTFYQVETENKTVEFIHLYGICQNEDQKQKLVAHPKFAGLMNEVGKDGIHSMDSDESVDFLSIDIKQPVNLLRILRTFANDDYARLLKSVQQCVEQLPETSSQQVAEEHDDVPLDEMPRMKIVKDDRNNANQRSSKYTIVDEEEEEDNFANRFQLYNGPGRG